MDPNARHVEAEAEKRIMQSLNPDLRKVLCRFRQGILTLHGVVSRSEDRLIAQQLIQEIEGIDIIDNQVVVLTKATPISDGKAMPDGDDLAGVEEPAFPGTRQKEPRGLALSRARTS